MGNRMPKTRVGFWQSKLEGNVKRDAEIKRQLRRGGWSILIIWECQVAPSRMRSLAARIDRFLARES
jgi:DNA mismatch endonuclease (patch repair protein)